MINHGLKLHHFIIVSDTAYIQEPSERAGLDKETEALKLAPALNLALR